MMIVLKRVKKHRKLRITASTSDFVVGSIGEAKDILFVVYTERTRKGDVTLTRIISARRATSFERGLYYGKY